MVPKYNSSWRFLSTTSIHIEIKLLQTKYCRKSSFSNYNYFCRDPVEWNTNWILQPILLIKRYLEDTTIGQGLYFLEEATLLSSLIQLAFKLHCISFVTYILISF